MPAANANLREWEELPSGKDWLVSPRLPFSGCLALFAFTRFIRRQNPGPVLLPLSLPQPLAHEEISRSENLYPLIRREPVPRVGLLARRPGEKLPPLPPD